MKQEIKDLLKDYVEADKRYKVRLFQKTSQGNDWEKCKEERDEIALLIVDRLAKQAGYIQAHTEGCECLIWMQRQKEDYKAVTVGDCELNYLREENVVIDNGRITGFKKIS